MIALTGAALCLACSSNATGTSDSDEFMNADLGDFHWASSRTIGLATAGTLTLSGDNLTSGALSISLVSHGPDTYVIGDQSNTLMATFTNGNITNTAWVASRKEGSGSITFTDLTDHSAAGTFSFQLISSHPDAAGNKVMTNGKFKLKW